MGIIDRERTLVFFLLEEESMAEFLRLFLPRILPEKYSVKSDENEDGNVI
jgi:hypothetical protein